MAAEAAIHSAGNWLDANEERRVHVSGWVPAESWRRRVVDDRLRGHDDKYGIGRATRSTNPACA
jgi:hypothetical protein